MTENISATLNIGDTYYRLRRDSNGNYRIERAEILKRTFCFATARYGRFKVYKQVNPATGREVECFWEGRWNNDICRVFYADDVLCTAEGGSDEAEVTTARFSARLLAKVM